MTFMPPAIGIELARERIDELHANAARFRRQHHRTATRHAGSSIRVALMCAPARSVRADGSLRPREVAAR